MIAQVDKLNITADDVVIVRVNDAENVTADDCTRLVESMRNRGMQNLVLCLAPGATLETVPEPVMNRHGWFKRARKRSEEDDG